MIVGYRYSVGISFFAHSVMASALFVALDTPVAPSLTETQKWKEVTLSSPPPPPPKVFEASAPPQTESDPVLPSEVSELPTPPPSLPTNALMGASVASSEIAALSTTSFAALGMPIDGIGTVGFSGVHNGTGVGAGKSGQSTVARLMPKQKLAPIVKVEPICPIEARRKKIGGRVKVEFMVLEDGSVEEPKVKSAEPVGIFEQSSIDAIARWKFPPQPTRQRVVQVLSFNVDKNVN